MNDENASMAECEILCRSHWSRLFFIARRGGCDVHDAQDAVQELFARLLRRGHLAPIAQQPEGVQTTRLDLRMRCHLVNRWRDRHRQRRGGGMVLLPLTREDGSEIEIPDLRGEATAAADARRRRRALERFRLETKPAAWARLSPWLSPSLEAPASQADGATRVALHRARRRLREILQAAGEDR